MERLEAPGMGDRAVYLQNAARGPCKIGFLPEKVVQSRIDRLERNFQFLVLSFGMKGARHGCLGRREAGVGISLGLARAKF